MLTRLKRYLLFGAQYFLNEKPRGLDFTMRDTSLLEKSHGLYHGYSKTSEKHLREIFDSISFVGGEKLLDIGCGKGVVLRVAAGYPFESVAGIEIDERLVSIAANNFRILGMADRLFAVSSEKTVTVIYHNPTCMESFEKKGKITVLRWLHDKTKNYKTCIFRIEPEGKVG